MIVINGRFLLHQITGVERYAREILLELDKLVKPGEVEVAIPPETEDIPNYENISLTRVGKLHNRLWEHISFPIYVKKKGAISLNLCNVAPLSSPGIVCIHDVKIKARPQDFSKLFLIWYNLLFFNACKRAKGIITVSEFSKKEICRYFNVEPERIVVIPNAWQHYERVGFDESALNKYGLEKDKYYFSMSSMEPNKNFKWIAEMAKRKAEYTFAVAGSINKAVFAEGLGFECPENMKLLGYVSDEEAKSLMRDCRAFLFPTFYEGFGIPPLEALSAGCKNVVVSDTEVMHEVFGDSATYIDPTDMKDLLIHIKHGSGFSEDKPLLKYAWSDSASKLKAYIDSMSNNRGD